LLDVMLSELLQPDLPDGIAVYEAAHAGLGVLCGAVALLLSYVLYILAAGICNGRDVTRAAIVQVPEPLCGGF
jgi:hypothetical protein